MTEQKKNVTTDVTDVEVQESLITYPTMFPMKIMGAAKDDFPETVASIAKAHFDDFDASTMKVGYSRTKKYMAVSIEVFGRSREQLDAMYRACTSHPDVKVVL